MLHILFSGSGETQDKNTTDELEENKSYLQEKNDLNSNQITPVKLNEKYGYIRNGRVVIEPQFDEIGKFSEGLSIVQKIESGV